MVARDDLRQCRAWSTRLPPISTPRRATYKVTPVFKGSYAETMNAGIAAFRAGKAPAILQIFEVGTATMMAAKGAFMPVYQLMKDAGEPFDPNAYLPAVTGYYSTADGRMLSMPFNSSTAVVFWNKDLFKKAGLDPDKPPATWPETFAVAEKLRSAGIPCGFTAAWISWTQLEQFSAWHNLAFASKAERVRAARMPGSSSTTRRSSATSPISPRPKRTRASTMAAAPPSRRASSQTASAG